MDLSCLLGETIKHDLILQTTDKFWIPSLFQQPSQIDWASLNLIEPDHSIYSETCIKRTPTIKRTVAEVPKFISVIYFKWNLYQADTSIKRTRTPKKYLKWSFLLFPTCIKRTRVIKFHHLTCQTPEMRKIDAHKFSFFTLKNVTWRTYLISFTVQLCFLFLFV